MRAKIIIGGITLIVILLMIGSFTQEPAISDVSHVSTSIQEDTYGEAFRAFVPVLLIMGAFFIGKRFGIGKWWVTILIMLIIFLKGPESFTPTIHFFEKILSEKWVSQTTAESGNVSNSSTEQVTSPQLPIDESQWKKVGEKTCEVAWNNKDFKDGWCLIGNFEPGEYRFKVRSGLRNKQPTGSDLIFPPEGLPTSDWKNSNNQTFADFFEEHSILKNNMVGMIIFRSGEEFPVAGWEMTLDQKESISMSINSRPAEASWKATRFYGKITAQVFKKKT